MINLPMSFALGKLVHKITQGSIYWADITSVFDGKAYKGASPGPIVLSRCRGARYLNYWGVLHKHIDEDVTDFKSASCHIHLLRLRTTSSVPQCYLVFLYRSDLPTNKAQALQRLNSTTRKFLNYCVRAGYKNELERHELDLILTSPLIHLVVFLYR